MIARNSEQKSRCQNGHIVLPFVVPKGLGPHQGTLKQIVAKYTKGLVGFVYFSEVYV
jgi:hypothetical protein